jgi:shikimate kinase
MNHRIIVCGGNGAGKSTLGKKLAQALSLPFLDIEDYYFPKTDRRYLYAVQRSAEEAISLLHMDVEQTDGFVLAAVKADYSAEISKRFTCAVFVEVPKETRMQRVRERSYGKFGDRMLPGGDLYSREQRFFQLVESRTEDPIRSWLAGLSIPVISVDGRRPPQENVRELIDRLPHE